MITNVWTRSFLGRKVTHNLVERGKGGDHSPNLPNIKKNSIPVTVKKCVTLHNFFDRPGENPLLLPSPKSREVAQKAMEKEAKHKASIPKTRKILKYGRPNTKQQVIVTKKIESMKRRCVERTTAGALAVPATKRRKLMERHGKLCM